MRTKTTILSAVALAAGLLSASAQVYSANVVGYYNVAVPSHKYALISNQLTNSLNDVNVVLGSGCISDAAGANNTVLYFWNGGGYVSYQYFTGADADNYFLASGSTSGWYDPTGVKAVEKVKQQTGHFLYNPAPVGLTNTFVGQVPQGSFARTIKVGFDTYSIVPPVSTNVDNTFASYPGTSDPAGANNDVLYIYNNGYSSFQYFTGADADNYFLASGSVNGWYDPTGVLSPSKQNVGQGFFIRHFGSPVAWNSSFTVQ